jgi:6-phosphogluconolactonase
MVVKNKGERQLFNKAVDIFMEEYRNSLENSGRFSVALSGGKTPKKLFKLLIDQEIEWAKVDIFMVDERYVPSDDAESNYKLLCDNLLNKVNIPFENVRSIKYMESLEASRIEYEKNIENFMDGRDYSFDLIVLGMGNDGHTASIFHDSIGINGTVVPSLENEFHKYNRISLGIGVINQSRKKLFILKKDKKEVLNNVLDGWECPASLIKENVTYLIDEEEK